MTVINVASSSSNVFNFEDVSAVLESSGAVTSSQLYGTEEDDELNQNSMTDPNAVQLRVGNSLGAGGSTADMFASASFGNSMGGGGGGRPPIHPHQIPRQANTLSGGVNVGASTSDAGNQYYNSTGHSPNSNYEPLFLAYSETTAPPPTPTHPALPQAPNTGLLRRRSEHRRSGRREQARRAASVGPSIAPRQPVSVFFFVTVTFSCLYNYY